MSDVYLVRPDWTAVPGAALQASSFMSDIAGTDPISTATTYEDYVDIPESPPLHPPPTGFILTGTVDLFGMDSLRADFYSHHVPLLPIKDATAIPIYQMAVLREDLRISSLLPSFAGTTFDVIALKNATFTLLKNKLMNRKRQIGFNFDADIVFDESYGQVHDVLVRFLGVPDPRLHLHCGLGTGQDWHRPLWISSFVLEGVFPTIHASPWNGVVFTRIGARLIGFHVLRYSEDGSMKTAKEFGYSVFGKMHLTVPGSSTPLDLDFDISEVSGMVSLTATLDFDWEHAFGIKQLTLQQVEFSVDFDLDEPFDSLAFDVSAVVALGQSGVMLSGSYFAQGDYALVASFENLSFGGLNNLFEHLHGETLSSPDIDIHIGFATLFISKESGLRLEVHDLRIGEHTACDGVVEIGSNGVVPCASIDSGVLALGEVHISKAFAEVKFGRQEKGTKTSVMLGGELQWLDFKFDVGVHIYRAAGSERGLEYTIHGKFANVGTGEGLRFVDLVPELAGTFMEKLTLDGAAIIIASRDDPEFGALSKVRCPIHQGIQVCAVLGEIDTVNSIMRSKSTALTLSATRSKKTGFEIYILLPSPTTLNLGRGITTDPIKLQVQLGGAPKLKLIAGANIPVEHRAEPLHFMFEFVLDELGASATGHLSAMGGWNNPYGISENLTIGPDLAFRISIIYETFVVSGLPSALGFVGGLQLGKVSGQLAFEVDEIPSRALSVYSFPYFSTVHMSPGELLSAKVNSLELSDVITFAGSLIGVKFPAVRIRHTAEIPGLSFGPSLRTSSILNSSRVKIFGITGEVNVTIGSEGVKANGDVDNFKLGPLTVSGYKSEKANFNLELTPAKQSGFIDGMITIFGTEVQAHCDIQLRPEFKFEFYFDLNFVDLFEFTVTAGPVQHPTEESPGVSDTDYHLTAEFHQKIRGHIATQINKMFDDLARQEERDRHTTAARLAEDRKIWQANVDKAQAELDAAHAAWVAKSEATNRTFAQTVDDQKVKVAELQQKLDNAAATLKTDVANTQMKLSASNAERATGMHNDEAALEATRAEWHAKIGEAHRKLDDATREMHGRFGDVERDIDEAHQKVDSLQWDIDNISRRIDECENADFWDLGMKAELPGLGIEIAAIWAAKAVADGALDIAKAVIEADDFITCKGVMEAGIDEVGRAGDLAISESDIFGLPNGLAPAQTGFFGLGLGFGCRSKPKPGRSACKPVCRLGKPVCSLSRETGLGVFLVPVGLISQSECMDYVHVIVFIHPLKAEAFSQLEFPVYWIQFFCAPNTNMSGAVPYYHVDISLCCLQAISAEETGTEQRPYCSSKLFLSHL
ncbi:hypothetical protein DFH07DRAFT_934976 [Mycena maculata]|uniref:Uncharacterized protein n=1 Tax=Mycena maculata TaxID=230809 RepID=A0AAD7KKB1_9AGAR|nr:hypothetical protein DFH07DRAFT_934976 [Mycena maculata]